MHLNRSDIRAPGAMRAAGLYGAITELVAFGTNPDVDGAEDIVAAGGLYAGFPVLPALADSELLAVVSSSAADDGAPGGTGARTVVIVGLDELGKLQSNTVILNGTTEVDTADPFYRVLYAYVASAGSGGTNAGAITIAGTTTAANAFATILAGIGRTQNAVLTVPTQKRGAISRVSASVVNNAAGGTAVESIVAVMRRRYTTGAWEELYRFPTSNLQAKDDHNFAAGIGLNPLDDVKLRVVATTGTNLVAFGSIEATIF